MGAEKLLKRWDSCRAATLQVLKAMPADKGDYRPTPEVMSFVEQFLHVVSAEKSLFDVLSGATPKFVWKTGIDARNYPTLAAAAKAAEDQAAATRAYLSSATDDDLGRVIDTGWGQFSAADLVCDWIIHETFHRGNMATYLRLCGVKPPEYSG